MNGHAGMTAVSLVLVAVLGVAGAAWFAQAPEGEDMAAGAAAQEATPSPTPTPTPTGGATEGAEAELPSVDSFRVTTYEVFLSRDPFEPVVVSVAAPEEPPENASPTTSPTTNPTTNPTTSPTTSPTASPTTSPTGSPSPDPNGTASPSPGDCVDNGAVVCDGQTVALVDVFNDGAPGAVVRVDGTIYEVRAGETFAGNFQVISLEPPCATLLFGDDAFTLCEGESTLK